MMAEKVLKSYINENFQLKISNTLFKELQAVFLPTLEALLGGGGLRLEALSNEEEDSPDFGIAGAFK